MRNGKLKSEELKVQASNAAKESRRCQYLAIVSTPVYKNLAKYSSTRCDSAQTCQYCYFEMNYFQWSLSVLVIFNCACVGKYFPSAWTDVVFSSCISCDFCSLA